MQRRVRRLTSHLFVICRRQCSAEATGSVPGNDDLVSIGDVSVRVQNPKMPHLVPHSFDQRMCLGPSVIQHSGNDFDTLDTLGHLRWMMQKHQLGQDMFLIGSPGPERRRLAFRFAEILKREIEYLPITRDTTESDLKQRRELRGGGVVFVDQAPVRAALHGRLLIIDGIERAERNVLPTLNNLLENREMNLEDGRTIVSHLHWQSLISRYSVAELEAKKIVSVSSQFLVIALGVAVPKYRGFPLDPPLRSRFQCRKINHPSPECEFELLSVTFPSISHPRRVELVKIAATLRELAENGATSNSLCFSSASLLRVASLISAFPHMSIHDALTRMLPVFAVERSEQVADHGSWSVPTSTLNSWSKAVRNVSVDYDKQVHVHFRPTDYSLDSLGSATIIQSGFEPVMLSIPPSSANDVKAAVILQETLSAAQRSTIARMLQDIASGAHVAIIGPPGCGKSSLLKHACAALGMSQPHIMHLYRDMTSRDLLLRRVSLEDGSTGWEPSMLIQAALAGHCIILDGLHQLQPDTLSSLSSLLLDGFCSLSDGRTLVRHDRWMQLRKKCVDDNELLSRGVFPILPSFRVFGASSSVQGSSGGGPLQSSWMTAETSGLFSYHEYPADDQVDLVTPLPLSAQMLSINAKLNALPIGAGNTNLSLRQILRILRISDGNQLRLKDTIRRTLMVDCLPNHMKLPINEVLNAACTSDASSNDRQKYEIINAPEYIRIGDVALDKKLDSHPALVPNVVFHDMQCHIKILKDMLTDWSCGERFMLIIGNQGVGKNKLADKLVQVLNFEREYIQLHRDTTVHALTSQPVLAGGKVTWDDSPLVRAARYGRVLIVDEADKAPLQVVCILKGLVEDGQMLLGDGRLLASDPSIVKSSNVVIPIHPSFRMIVLANRPGFPFLGNDFFKECGDVFSVHVVDNPDLDSEISLLQFYAPDVGIDVIRKLCRVFFDLRRAFDDSTITYPYSARELVNIVKHLQAFPADGVVEAVQNVVAFDAFNESSSATLIKVFNNHGIPIGVPRPTLQSVKLSSKVLLGPPQNLGTLSILRTSMPRRQFSSLRVATVSSPSLALSFSTIRADWSKCQTNAYTNFVMKNCPNCVTSARLSFFSELVSEFSSSSDHGHIRRMIRSDDGTIHTLMDPPAMHSYNAPDYSTFSRIDLSILSYFFTHQFRADKCFLFPLMNGEVGIMIQDADVFVKLQPSTGRLFYMKVPAIEFNDSLNSVKSSSSIGKAIYKFVSKPSISASQRLQLLLDCGVLVYSCSSGVSICFIDLVNDCSCSLDISDIFSALPLLESKNENYSVSMLAKIAADKVVLRCNSASSTLTLCLEISRLDSGSMPSVSVCIADLSFPLSCFSLGHLNESCVFGAGSGFNGASLDMSQLKQGTAHLIGFPSDGSLDVSRISCTNSRLGCIISSFVPPSTFHKQSHNDDWLRMIHIHSGDMFVIQSPRSLYASENNLSNMIFCDAPIVVIDLHATTDGAVSLHSDGIVRLWQLQQESLAFELGQWQMIWGDIANKSGQLRLNKDASDRKKDASSPKHGKHDPKNERHSGGNTWAGGTGGADTAGLGGKGGPYRLDTGGGHDIDQLSDEEKANLSDEVKQRARDMAKEALSKRLADIGMGERDASMYSEIYDRVKHEVTLMREVLNSVQTRQNEREWIRFQSAGDFDDGRIVDGATGDASVFKKRGIPEKPLGLPPRMPRILKIIVDCSGSMYRFNSTDMRLQRALDAVVMLLESLHGRDQFVWSLSGHSGDSHDIPLVQFNKYPQNAADRLKVIEEMHAHSQYCQSGDNTLEALQSAIEQVDAMPGDGKFVFLLSDANLRRYGISGQTFSRVLTSKSNVAAFAVFIGSLGQEAENLKRQLPIGRSSVCLDTSTLPKTFRDLFTTASTLSGEH